MGKKLPDVYRTTDKANRHHGSKEHLNPTPVAPPLGYERPPSMVDVVRQQIRLHQLAIDMEPETEEEADDFEIDDDPIMESRWENDHIPSIKQMAARREALERELQMLDAKTQERSDPGAPAPSSGGNEPPAPGAPAPGSTE